MSWILGIVVVVSGVISGLLGLTAGINLNPESMVRFVPAWGSLGDWFSGVGALVAVGVALWQSSAQQAKERIHTSLIDKSSTACWRVRLVSDGLIPVTVLGAKLKVKNLSLDLAQLSKGRPGFAIPTKLERGDVQQLIDVDEQDFDYFATWFMNPVLQSVRNEGLNERDMSYGVNENFFKAIESFRAAGITLSVRLAHDDLSTAVNPFIADQIFNSVVTRLRESAEQNALQAKESDQKFINQLMQQLPNEHRQ